MTETTHYVSVFSEEPEDADQIKTALGLLPHLQVTGRTGTLGQANGTAYALAEAGEIIIFRTSSQLEDDLDAVQQLCAGGATQAKVIAISDADLPLRDARKLLSAGVAEVLPSPATANDLSDGLRRLVQPVVPVAAPDHAQRGKILAVGQSRGGIGSTTLAINLAAHLQGQKGVLRRGLTHRVAVIDLDLQFGAVASLLNVTPNDALSFMAQDGTVPDATFLSQSMVHSKGGIAVLTAPTEFMPLDALSQAQVSALIEQVSLQFDFVVIDLPRTLVHWVPTVIARAERMFLVTDTTVPAIRQSKRLIDVYSESNPTLPIEVVVNMEAKPLVRGRHHVQASKLLERPLTHWLPADPKTAREASDRGVPLSAVSRRSRLDRAIGKLAATMAEAPPKLLPAPSADERITKPAIVAEEPFRSHQLNQGDADV